jgi:acid phosphatase
MKRFVVAGLVCASLIFAQPKPAPAPSFVPTAGAPELHLEADNLSDIFRTLANYAQSGQYEREISQVVQPAHDWVETRAASARPGEKLAAVFDIDETALSNVPNILNCGFCSASVQSKLFGNIPLPAIPQTLSLYNFAKSKGVAVILLTGRTEPARDATIRDLQTAGYSGWAELLLRPSGNTDPARIMKAGVRADIEKRGYRIILSIGDQLSDLIGGHAERTYKLPNPFYFVE